MKRVLVVGGGGMLGHKLWQVARDQMETWATVRRVTPALEATGLGAPTRMLAGVDVSTPDILSDALDRVRPHVAINCIGIVKQLAAAKDPVPSITINALHPHVLARACVARGIRLIHISTDCVFDGMRGHYTEDDAANATDLYGRTKALGEVTDAGCLTLRTSIIGRELSGVAGLVEWFLSRRGGTAQGFRRAIFSGLTTLALSRVILRVIEAHPNLTGLYHVSADPIDKYRLLQLLDAAYGAGVAITPQDEPHIDRTLDSQRFRTATGIVSASWESMVQDMARDATPYDFVRSLG